jgi:hypothetical protein
MTNRADRLRQHHAAPLTWEVPTLVAVLCVAVACVIPLTVQGLAARAVSGRWVWPTGHEGAAVASIARGDFGIGLSTLDRAALPPGDVLWAATALVELLVFGGGGLILLHVLGTRLWSGHGLAGRGEARRALGRGALMRRRFVLRPDLDRRTNDGAQPLKAADSWDPLATENLR